MTNANINLSRIRIEDRADRLFSGYDAATGARLKFRVEAADADMIVEALLSDLPFSGVAISADELANNEGAA